MFPVQLMSVRRSNKGILRSVLLTEENSNYCSAILDLFNSSIGKTRNQIEEELKTMELKVQNPKILRGLAFIMFRSSEFRRPSSLDSERVRKVVFSLAKGPLITPDERKEILAKAAAVLVADVEDVENALYSDMDGNKILVSPARISLEKLARVFNREQIETVVMKSLWVDVSTERHSNEFIRSLKSKGLPYSEVRDENKYKIRVNGPMSIFERSEKYGVKFSRFVRDVIAHDDWGIDALVSLKENGKKKEYIYHLDSSIKEIIDTEIEKSDIIPDFVNTSPTNINAGYIVVAPDYSINVGEDVFIFISRPASYDSDIARETTLRSFGFKAETFCIIDEDEKCPKGAMCFKGEVDWWRVKEFVSEKYGRKLRSDASEGTLSAAGTLLSDKIVSHLNSLYPDSQAMIDYLDFMGLQPEESLRKAGFKTEWKGLRLVVTGRIGEKY
ncbi:MAG: DUF790 family protein [Thermoplasmatales archaeon]